MKRAMNVKQMIEVTKRAVDNEDLANIRNSFYVMLNLGFITHEEWKKYADETDCYFVEDTGDITDCDTGEVLVFKADRK